MATKEQIIDLLTEKCETELDYYEIVNERSEKIDYRLIVEFVLDNVFDVWKDGNNV